MARSPFVVDDTVLDECVTPLGLDGLDESMLRIVFSDRIGFRALAILLTIFHIDSTFYFKENPCTRIAQASNHWHPRGSHIEPTRDASLRQSNDHCTSYGFSNLPAHGWGH